jgi:hypothetical protein
MKLLRSCAAKFSAGYWRAYKRLAVLPSVKRRYLAARMQILHSRVPHKSLKDMADKVIATDPTVLQADESHFPIAAAVLFTSALLGLHRQAGRIMRAHPELVNYPLSKGDFPAGADVTVAAGQKPDRIYLVHMQAGTLRVSQDERDAYDANTRFILQKTPMKEVDGGPRLALEQAIKMAEHNRNERFIAATVPYQPRLSELKKEDQKFAVRVEQRGWQQVKRGRRIKSRLNFFGADPVGSGASLDATLGERPHYAKTARRPAVTPIRKVREATTNHF